MDFFLVLSTEFLLISIKLKLNNYESIIPSNTIQNQIFIINMQISNKTTIFLYIQIQLHGISTKI